MYYDRNGNPLNDVLDWAQLKEDMDYCQVALDEVCGHRVSTIWRGLDMTYGPGGPPLIFESMVFGPSANDYTNRYPTLAEALAGHEEIVTLIRSTEEPAGAQDPQQQDGEKRGTT